MVGLREVATLTHALETMLDLWRSAELQPEPPHFSALLRSADMLRAMIELPAESPDMPAHAALASEIEQLCRQPAANSGNPTAPPSAAGTHVRVRFTPQPDAFHWGGDPLLVLRELRALSSSMHVRTDASALPALSELQPDTAYFGWELELDLLPDVDVSRVQEAFSFFDGAASVQIEQAQAEPAPRAPSAHAPANDNSAAPRTAATAAWRCRKPCCSRIGTCAICKSA